MTPNGGFVLGSGLSEGQALRFHVRDRESAESDLKLMLKRYRWRLLRQKIDLLRLERSFSGGNVRALRLHFKAT